MKIQDLLNWRTFQKQIEYELKHGEIDRIEASLLYVWGKDDVFADEIKREQYEQHQRAINSINQVSLPLSSTRPDNPRTGTDDKK